MRIPFAATVAALVLLAATAHAEGWSIGANMGVSVLNPKGGGDKLLVAGAPSNSGAVIPTFQPGLRFGSPPSGRNFDGYFDVGFSLLNSEGGGTATSYQVTANLQHNSPANRGRSPYLTAGGDVVGQTYSGGEHLLNPIAGGGIGLMQIVGRGHGARRGEIRYDYIF